MNEAAIRENVLMDFSFKDLSDPMEIGREEPRVVQKGNGLKALRLYNNHLTSFTPLPSTMTPIFSSIAWIDLSFNAFTHIDPALSSFPNLTVLYLHANQITHINDIDILIPLTRLKTLTLHGNPVEKTKGYRIVVLSKLPQLVRLDFSALTKLDRQMARKLLESKRPKNMDQESTNGNIKYCKKIKTELYTLMNAFIQNLHQNRKECFGDEEASNLRHFTDCSDLKLLSRGKVRDLYDIDDSTLLFVATDRISAFDVIMKSGIASKGVLLTKLSTFWFSRLGNIVPNHFITSDIDKMPPSVQKYKSQLEGRCMLVKKLKILPVEAIVRGYITGSAMVEYKAQGTVCGIPLPAGLVESQKLETPLFTPSTKAEIGDHDENISIEKLKEIIGTELATKVEKTALALYSEARDYALTKGIIIADTKFEFGVDEKGNLVLADEVLTPDSSRFWPLAEYTPGKTQPSYDKQYLRNYLLSIQFDKKNGIELPEEIIKNTVQKYEQVLDILTH